MNYIGFHVSALGGVNQAVIRANNLKSTSFSFFTKNQRRWISPDLNQKNILLFKQLCKKYHFDLSKILPHSSYLINLGHYNPFFLNKSINSFIDEINRCNQLGLSLLNVHPGNHLYKISEEKCLQKISHSINTALKFTKNVCVVIENTAGQGSSVGYNFQHLSKIISRIEDKSRIGVCLDTCHLFSSGYSVISRNSCNNVLDYFNEIVGIKYLKGLHLNDAKSNFFSKVDRHHSLGYGNIGIELFKWVMNNSYFENIPIIIESINSDLWNQEIEWLRSLKKK
ncbi:deoxyribonuclease IV [Buchnera aphidicola (Kurisakia onigurumii)]|uniref:deoxyribonuclease IV n=1 Tax=Buchnera aphidicola TaxID=9 RepID=UPI0031B675BB